MEKPTRVMWIMAFWVGVLFVLAGCKSGGPKLVTLTTQTMAASDTVAPMQTPLPSNTALQTTPATRPTSTPTRRRTATPRPTLTLHPTLTRSPTITRTSDATLDVSAYRLRPWIEEDSTELIMRVQNTGGWQMGSLGNFLSTLEAERLLRFNQSANWDQMAWEAADISPNGISLPGMRPGQDFFGFLVEDLLNNKGVALEDLHDAIFPYHFFVYQTIPVYNLFGDGQDASVFGVENNNQSYQGIFVIHFVDGMYHLEMMQDWTVKHTVGATWYGSIQEVGDTNGNGFPEVMVAMESHFSGTPTYAGLSLELYEWVKKDKTFTAYYPDYFFQNCDQGPCEWKWNFALVDRYGVQPLTVSEFLYLSFWLGEGTPKCTDIETQRFYRWQGGKITLEREVYLPSQSDELYCRIAWAIAVIRGKLHGWQDDDAINILADALKDWPEIMNTTWGPASQDYFYLQMGIWRDFRGEEEDALTLLQLLAENPTDPQYTLPARLASTYLEERSRSGFVGACTQVQRLWKDAVNELPESHGMYTHYPKDIRLAWGFADDRWGPYGIEDLCSRQDSFYALRSLQNLGFSP